MALHRIQVIYFDERSMVYYFVTYGYSWFGVMYADAVEWRGFLKYSGAVVEGRSLVTSPQNLSLFHTSDASTNALCEITKNPRLLWVGDGR